MNKEVQELFLELIDIAFKNSTKEKTVTIELSTGISSLVFGYFENGECETNYIKLGISEKIMIEELKTEKDKMMAFLEVKNIFYETIGNLDKYISDLAKAGMKIYDTENPEYMINKIYYDEAMDKICVNFKEDK